MSFQTLLDAAEKSRLYQEGKLPPEEARALTQRLKLYHEATQVRMREIDIQFEKRLRATVS